MFESSTRLVNVVGGAILFYAEITTTNLYVETIFGGLVNTVTVTNDSDTDTISLSFDGATLIADIKPAESLTIHTQSNRTIYVKGDTGGGTIRMWGW